MPTAKAILYKRYQSKDKTYPIVIRLIDGSRQKLHTIGYKVLESQFKAGQVVKHEDSAIINSVIDTELLKAKKYFADCRAKNIPVDLALAFSDVKSHSFTGYIKKRGEQYKAKGQVIMWRKAQRLSKELESFYGREVYFTDVTPEKLRDFDAYLLPNVANTRIKKFEFLSRWYGNALDEGLVTGKNPFKGYKIQSVPVKKEKLTKAEMEALESLPLKSGAVKLARDLFLFSFYCKGIRFETVITMQNSAVDDNRIHFQTNKGKKFLSQHLHSRLKAIVEAYGADNGYLFPVLTEPLAELTKDPFAYRKALDVANTLTNRNLKTAAKLAGIKKPVTFHIARHTFAYLLKQVSSNIHVIKDSLGHSKSDITEVYLKELDDQFLDAELHKLYGD